MALLANFKLMPLFDTMLHLYHNKYNTCKATWGDFAVVHFRERQTLAAIFARFGLQKATTETPETSSNLIRGPIDIGVVQPVSDLVHLTNVFCDIMI